MPNTIKRIQFDSVGTRARVTFARDDGTVGVELVDLSGPKLTALIALAQTQLAAIPPRDLVARAAARTAHKSSRAARKPGRKGP